MTEPRRPRCLALTRAGDQCQARAANGSDFCGAHGGGRRPQGRPSKLTPPVAKAILDNVAAGATYEVASDAAGIHARTLASWRERGELDLERGHATRYAEFVQDLERARAQGEASLVAVVRRHSALDWRAAAWLLERRFPARWRRRDALELEGAVGVKAEQTVTPSAERAREIAAILQEAGAVPKPPTRGAKR